MEWNDLQKMTVVKLREEALNHPGITGVTGKTKAQLVDALAEAMGIEKPHTHFTRKVVRTKGEIKKHIKELKVERDKLIEAHDSKKLRSVRREIHHLKRQIKKIEIQALRQDAKS